MYEFLLTDCTMYSILYDSYELYCYVMCNQKLLWQMRKKLEINVKCNNRIIMKSKQWGQQQKIFIIID